MIDIVEYTKFLAKNSLTSNQFLILSLTAAKRFDLVYSYVDSLMKNSKKVWNSVGGLSITEIEDLVDKELILNLNKDDNYFLDAFIVTDKFHDMFKTLDFTKALEFWTAYPQTITINRNGKDVRYNAKNVDKDKFLLEYVNKIGNNLETHKQILITLEAHKEKGLINSKIDKWFDGKPWEDYIPEEIKPKSDLI